jgi:hypothetical protein
MRRFLLTVLLSTTLCRPAAAQQASWRIDLGGYASARYEHTDAGSDSLLLRRLAASADVRWRDRARAFVEGGTERLAEVELQQAWMELRLGPVAARGGAVLPPVGRFNLEHQDHLSSFPRRPLVGGRASVLPVAATWTALGLGLHGEHAIGARAALSWQAYVVDGVTLDVTLGEPRATTSSGRALLVVPADLEPTSGELGDERAPDALTGRLALTTAAGSELALSGYLGTYTPDDLDLDARLRALGLDGRARIGPMVGAVELLTTWYADVDRAATAFGRAAYERATATPPENAALETAVEMSFAALADRRSGFWLDLSWPLPLPAGTLGFASPVLAPVARYEHVWLDRDVVELTFADARVARIVQADREQARLAVGATFRPTPRAVLQLVFEVSRARAGPMIDPAVEDRLVRGLVVGLAVGF